MYMRKYKSNANIKKYFGQHIQKQFKKKYWIDKEFEEKQIESFSVIMDFNDNEEILELIGKKV